MNTTRTWKRVVAVVMAVLMMLGAVPLNPYMAVQTNAATATKVYMKPNSDWRKDGARFAAYFFNNSTNTNTWVSMTDSDGDGIYEANVPSGYPSVIFVRMNGANTTNNWDNKWNQTGDLTVPTGNNVLYSISGWSSGSWGTLSFDVSFSLSNVSKSSGNATATYGTNYSATLTASSGYSLPGSITVKAGSTPLTSGTHYNYSSSTGAITIFGSAITGKITITASGVSASHNVAFSLSNVTKVSGNDTATGGVDYTATLAAVSGYHLPGEIVVTVGSDTLVAGTGYAYDRSTGEVTVNAAYVTGDINISATAKKDYYTVVGTESLTGSDWVTTDSNNIMTENSDGTYTLNYTNVAAGTYEIKVVKNAAYENGQWPQSGNYSFTVAETSNVTIKLDLNTHTLTAEVFSLVSHYPVTFNGTNVTSNGAAGANDEADYTATLSATTGYKLPDTITVTIGGITISASQYTYDSSTGLLTIPKNLITGAVKITAEAQDSVFIIAGTESLTGSDWDTEDTNNQMTKGANGVYTIIYNDVPAGTHKFKVTENGNWRWPDENYELNLTSDSIVEISYDPVTGTGTVLVKKAMDANTIFYVDTDIVDYLNDNRVINKQINGYYTDNQGIWNNPGDAPYSYLNDLISQQAYYGHYTYPLYFGPLNYIASRYSRATNSSNQTPLGRWYSAVNTAMANNGSGTINTDAAVQGLVGNRLVNGNLADPVTGQMLLYFNKEAAETWTNQGGDYPVMAYYADLQFPFKMTYDKTNRVTTYSYDSASDYAVYYDYANKQLYTSDEYILDSPYDDDKSSTDYGFYPLNRPGDSENETNNGFGVKFTIDFTVGPDGLLANGEPVAFDFTGDDDVWVFIDDVLVLDMGGAHAKASGRINFNTQTATVDDAYTISGSPLSTGDSHVLGSYQNQGLPNWVYNNSEERATVSSGKSEKSFADLGLTEFDYNAVHTMTVFYVERGMVESNFSMEFTMVPVPSGLTISKELNDADINAGLMNAIGSVSDYDFTLSASSPDNLTSVAFSNYSLTEKFTGMVTTKSPNGTIDGKTFTALISGITDYTYAHSFLAANGDPAFIPGTNFTITENTKSIFSYSSITWQVYDAKNGYEPLFQSPVSGKEATFKMGNAGDTTAYSYAVTCKNTMNVGALQIKKVFNDSVLQDELAFTFEVYLDLDGSSKSNFGKTMYAGLVYTVDGGEPITSEDGTITIKGGQTAVISGIPAGATYEVVEVIPADAPYSLSSSSGTSGSITTGSTKTATFTNTTNSSTLDKVIFVEAGTPTTYIPKDSSGNAITNLTVGSNTIIDSNTSSLTVTGADPDKVYTVDYSGRLTNNEIVTGTITVYTFAATDKVYVFDFGLPADLAATNTNGDGLFQGGYFYNEHVSGESVKLATLTGVGNTQTTITATTGRTIGTSGTYNTAITFQPVAFMTQVETYTYTVKITASGKTFDANDPETGTTVTGSIKVMPANAVYYEDNFNATGSGDETSKIIYSGKAPTSNPSLSQSHDQSTHYGYDDAYLGGYAQSNGAATEMSNGEYAYFTFTGTGFDLISHTNGSSAGFGVYVFSGPHDPSHITAIQNYNGTNTVKMVFVDTYYNNGDLYQVPVVSVRLATRATYTVYVQALTTVSGRETVSVDGVRIYNPLSKTEASQYPLVAEQNTTIEELRVLYGVDGIVSLAGRNDQGVFEGLGKMEAVTEAMGSIVENMEDDEITCVTDLQNIFVHGPNNEMYLPINFGISFSYKVTDSDWTLQLGAKAVTTVKTEDGQPKDGTPKSFTVYARTSGKGSYTALGTVTLSSTTDMYYELNDLLTTDELKAKFGGEGSYDIIIISESPYANNEFVSLTTVKHSGIEWIQ